MVGEQSWRVALLLAPGEGWSPHSGKSVRAARGPPRPAPGPGWVSLGLHRLLWAEVRE